MENRDIKSLPNGIKVISRKVKGTEMTPPKLTLLDATSDQGEIAKSSQAHWIKGKQVAKRQALDTQIKQVKKQNHILLIELRNCLIGTPRIERAYKLIDLIAKGRQRMLDLNVQWKAIQDGLAIEAKAIVPRPSAFKIRVKRKIYKMFSEK